MKKKVYACKVQTSTYNFYVIDAYCFINKSNINNKS